MISRPCTTDWRAHAGRAYRGGEEGVRSSCRACQGGWFHAPSVVYRLVETNHLLPLTHAQVCTADANPRPPFIQSSAASESHALCARSSRRPTRRSWRMPCPMSPRPPRARASTSLSKKWTSLIMSSPSQWYALLPPLGHPQWHAPAPASSHQHAPAHMHTNTHSLMHTCTHAHLHV